MRMYFLLPDCGFISVPTRGCSPAEQYGTLCLQIGLRLTDQLMDTIHAWSVYDCGLQCLAKPACLSAQFRAVDNTCELNSQSVSTAGELDAAPGWIFLSTNVC